MNELPQSNLTNAIKLLLGDPPHEKCGVGLSPHSPRSLSP